nr:hypothetical protein [Tanacetum cinerariifolium]
MKVIKERSEKLRLLKINDDSFAYNSPLGIIFDEFNRLSGMDDDLFTYEVEIPEVPSIHCEKKEVDDSDDGDLDIFQPRVCYDENDEIYAEVVIFDNKRFMRLMDIIVEQWLDLIGYDEVELTNEEFSDPDDENLINKDEVVEIFRIKTEIFDFETPVCKAFNKFNYLLKIDVDLLTSDILRFKTYDEFKNEWMDKWNKGIPWVLEEPWSKNEIPIDDIPHICKPFCLKNRNDEEAIHEERKINNEHNIDNLDYGLVQDNASYHANNEEYKEDRCEMLKNPCQKPSVCKIKRFELIKYSFGPAENYISIKECEHDDWKRTEDDACHAYQEIFCMMDEGWKDPKNLGLLKINDDSFACNSPLGSIFDKFNRLSGMDDELFTYDVEIPERVCYDENDGIYDEAVTFVNKRLVRLMDITIEQWLDLMPGDHKKVDIKIKEGVISKWLALKFYNRKTIDQYTKNALWIYWTRGDDETEDLDAYDSDCDDLSSAKAVLMANLSNYDPEVLSEVPYFDSYLNDMINHNVQEMQYSKPTHIDDF